MNNAKKIEEGQPNPLSYLFGNTWRYSAGNRQNIVCYWILFIIANTLEMILQPLVLAKVMDTIQKEGVVSKNITFICGLLLVTILINIIFWTFHGPARVIERLNAFKARANYKRFLLRGVMMLPLDWHSDHHSGDTIDKVEKGTIALHAFSGESFLVIQSVVQLLISYVMLTYFSPSAGVIVLVMMAITAWITTRFDKVLIGEYKEINQAENKITASIFDSVSNITTVIILRVERLVYEAISKKIDMPYALFKKNSIRIEVKWFLTNMCGSAMTVIVLSVYFYLNINSVQGILIGNVYLLFKYLDTVGDLFFRFCSMYGDVLQRKAKVMNAEEVAVEFKPGNFTNHVLPIDWKLIEMSNLSFSYQNGENVAHHLDGVSLSIKRGERIALVGHSGSGKTTLLKVIRDLYIPRSISLEVDGETVSQGFAGIARAIALVPQDPEIFAKTILENITLGAEYSPETVRRYTDMACFTDVVASLPKGLESAINEKGVNLSGGQRQRLALARGLLACEDKSIVLLDEPTSSVDIVNEGVIYRNIFEAFPDKSIISSIHRLHLLPNFDQIYMFENGRIVGHGTLAQLLSSCPEFQTLWSKYRECDRSKDGSVGEWGK